MTSKEIKKFILNFIYINYGKSERDNPCYNIKELANELANELEKREKKGDPANNEKL